MIVSSFLPLGPTGLAGFSLVKLGKDAIILIPATGHAQNSDYALVGPALYGAGLVGAMLLWGLGVSLGSIFSLGTLYWADCTRDLVHVDRVGQFLPTMAGGCFAFQYGVSVKLLNEGVEKAITDCLTLRRWWGLTFVSHALR